MIFHQPSFQGLGAQIISVAKERSRRIDTLQGALV
jgi:hypothetical protein